jgi:hypothetical protein
MPILSVCIRLLSPLIFLLLVGTISAQPYRDPDADRLRIRAITELNSTSDDYAPFMTASRQRLYFTSSRGDDMAKIFRSASKGEFWDEPDREVDTTINDPYSDNGSFNAPFPAAAQLFSLSQSDYAQLHYASVGIFTMGKRPGNVGDADLYTIKVGYNEVDLVDPGHMPVVNSDAWDAQGTMSSDGSYIIFSSTRSSGEGGMDLWIADRTVDGGYGEPRNLGSVINTSGNEFSPFLAADGRTLFFSSTGHGGFGAADIFRTSLMPSGKWIPPVNLGDKINTSANELFFFCIGRDRFFFASDRSGGKGGLDLYEGGPNIFAPSYSMVKISIPDTTIDRPLKGRVKIIETSLGRTVAELEVDYSQDAEIPLPSGLNYRIETLVPEFGQKVTELTNIPPDTTVKVKIRYGSTPPAPEMTFEIDGVNVPLFVSGYYRINTQTSLDDLRRRQESEMKRLTYITDVRNDTAAYNDYVRRAGKVQSILDDFYHRCVDRYFPGYIRVKKPKERLEILVYGYADPRPILGSYMEKPITFYDSSGKSYQVRTGEKMDNFKLGGLRAYYAVQYLDARFREAASQGHSEYKNLLDAGVIRWMPVSGNVDARSGGDDLAQKRRIRVVFRRIFDGG